MSFWSFLKWMLSKKQRPVFPTDGYSLYYDKTGDAKLLSLNCWEPGPNNFALWLELMERLMEGRACATYIEQWSYDSKREIKNKTEIIYSATFPAFFAQEHPEEYRDLVVKVAGYSAYFNSLDKGLQDQIIERTEHSL